MHILLAAGLIWHLLIYFYRIYFPQLLYNITYVMCLFICLIFKTNNFHFSGFIITITKKKKLLVFGLKKSLPLCIYQYIMLFHVSVFFRTGWVLFSCMKNAGNNCRSDINPGIVSCSWQEFFPWEETRFCEIGASEQWIWVPAHIKPSLPIPSWPKLCFSLKRISALIKSGMEKDLACLWDIFPLTILTHDWL